MEHPNNMILWMITSIWIFGLSQSDDVRVPPTIQVHPEAELIYSTNDTFTISCQASGNPNPTITWRESNNAGGPWDLVKDSKTKSLNIRNTRQKEHRYYQCSARNKWGTALSRITHVSRAYIKNLAAQQLDEQGAKVEEGDGIMIHCEGVVGYPKPLDYLWQKVPDKKMDGPYIKKSNRIGITEKGSLVFTSVLRTDVDCTDCRLFKCEAIITKLDIHSGASYHALIVNNVDTIVNKKPKIMYSTESKEALKGKKKILECFFSGHPAPHVTWSKSGGIPDNASPDGNKLVFKKIDFIHEGEYKCTGKNSEGSAEKTLQLTVAASPYWESEEDKLHNLEVVEGQTAEFVCKPTAVPEANVVWMKNTEVLDPSNPGFKTSINGSKLMIEGVCKNCVEPDIANYHCFTNNTHGYSFSSGYLNVITKTEMTVKPRNRDLTELGENETNKIELLCDAVGDPIRPLEFIWLKDDQLIDDQDNVMNFNKTTNTLTLFLEVYATKEEMYDALAGIYKCQATNGVSTAFATAALIGPKPTYLGWLYLIIAVIVLVGFLVLAGVVCFVWRSITEDDKYYSSRSNSAEIVEAIQEPTTGELELQVPGDQAKPSTELQVPGDQAKPSPKKSIEPGKRPSNLAKAPRKLSNAPPKLSNAPRKLANAPRKLSKAPPKLSNAPPKLSKAPPKLSNAPPELSKAPPKLSNAPTELLNAPTEMSNAPRILSNAPRKFSNASRKFSNAFPILQDAPSESEKLSNAPRILSNAPRKFSNASRKFSNAFPILQDAPSESEKNSP